jgi:hypothetical protein
VNFRQVPERVSHYLSTGGLWNPELADHDEVRNMLIDARDVIEMLIREREHTGYEMRRLQMQNEHLVKLLAAVSMVLPPEDMKLDDGRVMRFEPKPDLAMDMLRGFRDRIKAIHEEFRQRSQASDASES